MTSGSLSIARRTRLWQAVDAERFRREIVPLGRPAVLKGLVAHWPTVALGAQSARALATYLKRYCDDAPVRAFHGAPAIKGRFFYSDDLKGFNYEQQQLPLAAVLDALLRHLDDADPPSIYAGAAPITKHLPGMLPQHAMALLAPGLDRLVSIWIGNRTRIAAHWDLPQNLACVVAGRRRYTLFPIEQLPNLYVGPLDFTLAGQPISLVDFAAPDYERHPRFAQALAHAELAELEPGDALYLPSLWFHHAESLDAFGVMINHWWRDAAAHMYTPFLTMLHALLSLRDLPPAERAAWKVLFDYYIFQTQGDPMAHLPLEARGIFGELTPERIAQLRNYLAGSLNR